ncbi:hypothetical protein BM221_003386 [Beauveria bassiana]|uniref:Uncharacterized protein n=1 Tax=Beauveria bassiana TaxID=176275 RepID=A0A2N6NUH8_BEABA|nr:hypothetical protein BM221_003386 [Beauveria bassiana]
MESETQVLHANAADGISRPSSTPTPESTSLAHQPFPNLASLATSTTSGTTTTPLVSRDVLMHQPPPAVHMEGSPAATSGGPGGMSHPGKQDAYPLYRYRVPESQKTFTPAGPISVV